ncbi:2-oxoglutarate (2OG) and Fe(II)-dependent oxygenase superfamily protein [Striga asiatica]|uniref:2-oxoglutarate (2OG) and Fe(II)-dependent oxygenase superfamily protein n=1 Tax=Striga asiatica TaxID=4170 RepID=A0A5A7Q4X0_STRAF|nr:2-oxoglutarate (2OG) and Fe(II)-dependent oxygenase superfamily protein [Striga asiatica]
MEYTRRLPSLVPPIKHSSGVTVSELIDFPAPAYFIRVSSEFIERNTIWPWSPAQTRKSPQLLSSRQLSRPFDSTSMENTSPVSRTTYYEIELGTRVQARDDVIVAAENVKWSVANYEILPRDFGSRTGSLFGNRTLTCNAAHNVFVMSDTLHHSSITEGHDLKTIFPVATGDEKALRWCLQGGKALCSKLKVISKRTPNFTRGEYIGTNPKERILHENPNLECTTHSICICTWSKSSTNYTP